MPLPPSDPSGCVIVFGAIERYVGANRISTASREPLITVRKHAQCPSLSGITLTNKRSPVSDGWVEAGRVVGAENAQLDMQSTTEITKEM